MVNCDNGVTILQAKIKEVMVISDVEKIQSDQRASYIRDNVRVLVQRVLNFCVYYVMIPRRLSIVRLREAYCSVGFVQVGKLLENEPPPFGVADEVLREELGPLPDDFERYSIDTIWKDCLSWTVSRQEDIRRNIYCDAKFVRPMEVS